MQLDPNLIATFLSCGTTIAVGAVGLVYVRKTVKMKEEAETRLADAEARLRDAETRKVLADKDAILSSADEKDFTAICEAYAKLLEPMQKRIEALEGEVKRLSEANADLTKEVNSEKKKNEGLSRKLVAFIDLEKTLRKVAEASPELGTAMSDYTTKHGKIED
jgi:hypothetical protein